MTRRVFRAVILGAAVVSLGFCASAVAGPPEGFALRTLVRGLDEPTAFAWAPDGRIYITRKKGIVSVFDHGRLSVFLDLRSEVNEYDERGLVNVALDPAFSRNRTMYLLYTAEGRPDDPDKLHPGRGTLISLRVSTTDPDLPEPGSRRTILSGFEARGPWHAVAGLAFDARGRLLVGFGDGSPYYPESFSAEALWTYDLDVLNGKIVRVDPVTGHGVPDNPFFDASDPDAVRSKILAYGFRNPFSIQFDPGTGDIYVGDVGTDQWEEIDVVAAKAVGSRARLNFGWPCFEGGDEEPAPQPAYRALPQCAARFYERESSHGDTTIAPLYAYDGADGAAVVVGPVYRGASYPGDAYGGRLFFADWVDDRFWTLDGDRAADFGDAGGWGNPVDIGAAPDGSVAYLGFSTGTLNQIVHVGGEDEGDSTTLWILVGCGVGLALVLVWLGSTIVRQWRAA